MDSMEIWWKSSSQKYAIKHIFFMHFQSVYEPQLKNPWYKITGNTNAFYSIANMAIHLSQEYL